MLLLEMAYYQNTKNNELFGDFWGNEVLYEGDLLMELDILHASMPATIQNSNEKCTSFQNYNSLPVYLPEIKKEVEDEPTEKCSNTGLSMAEWDNKLFPGQMNSVNVPVPIILKTESIVPPKVKRPRKQKLPGLPLPQFPQQVCKVKREIKRENDQQQKTKQPEKVAVTTTSKTRKDHLPLYCLDPNDFEEPKKKVRIQRALNTKVFHDKKKKQILHAEEILKMLSNYESCRRIFQEDYKIRQLLAESFPHI